MQGRRGLTCAALALLIGAVAGCGDDGSSRAQPQARPTSTSQSQPALADPKQRAIESLLTESDLEGSRVQGEVIAYGPRELRRLGARAAEMGSGGALAAGCPTTIRPGSGIAFAMTQLVIEDAATAVASMTAVFRDERLAREAVTLYDTAATRDCLAEASRRNMRAAFRRTGTKATVGRVTARTVELPAVGDARSGFVIELPVSSRGRQNSIYAEHIVVQDGAAIGLVTSSPGVWRSGCRASPPRRRARPRPSRSRRRRPPPSPRTRPRRSSRCRPC
jgi:hypothetical protein